MTSWNCCTISGPITLIGGLSIVTRQYAGDRSATRSCCADFIRAVAICPPSAFHELDPLGTPCRRIERVAKILCFVDYLVVLELHDADRVELGASQIRDRVFGDPQFAASDDPLDLEPRRLAGVMAAQSLQVAPADDPLAGLWIVADRVVGIDVVFGLLIARRGSRPVPIQRSANRLLLHESPFVCGY